MNKFKFPSEIIVASLEVPNFFEFPSGKDFDIKPTGSEGKFLELLSEALNFKYKLRKPAGQQWGSRLENGTWTGLVGMVSNGDADMAVCFSSISVGRQEVVDFSEPYFYEERTFATDFPQLFPKAYAYVFPFDEKTWCGILISILLVSFLLKLLKLARVGFMSTFLSVLGNICGRGIDEREFKRNVLLAFWWIFSFVVSSSYAAVLASLLALPVYESSPKNLYELAKFINQKSYKVVVAKHTSLLHDMLNSQKDRVVYIAKTMEKNNWFLSSEKYLHDDNFEANTAVLGPKSFLSFRFGKAPLSTKFISEDSIDVTKVGIMLNKHFCCKDALDAVIKKIVGGGLYQRIMDFQFYKAWLRASNTPIEDKNFSFALEDVFGPFVVLLLGYFLSAVVFLSEILI